MRWELGRGPTRLDTGTLGPVISPDSRKATRAGTDTDAAREPAAKPQAWPETTRDRPAVDRCHSAEGVRPSMGASMRARDAPLSCAVRRIDVRSQRMLESKWQRSAGTMPLATRARSQLGRWLEGMRLPVRDSCLRSCASPSWDSKSVGRCAGPASDI